MAWRKLIKEVIFINYIEVLIAILILGIAISVVFPTISAQKIYYEKIKQKELVQLYAENIFWANLYNFDHNSSDLKVLSTHLSEENFSMYKNGEKILSLRKIMNLELLFNGRKYDVEIVYDNRKWFFIFGGVQMIKAKNLTKKFKDVIAVDHINIDVPQGQIFGFLGPNGAGKTTTIRMLTGTLKPTDGEVEILGLNLKKHEIEIKRRIGVVPDEPRIYSHLKGFEYLEFVMDIYRINNKETLSKIEDLCNAFGVNYLEKMISDMSHGMKQKLILISVLMRKPEVVFLDEPTVGLDAKSAKILKELLKNYAKQGTTIFLTTHILEIAEYMCDVIAIINNGKIITQGTMEELKKQTGDENKTLEDLFLKLTAQEEDIKHIVESLSRWF